MENVVRIAIAPTQRHGLRFVRWRQDFRLAGRGEHRYPRTVTRRFLEIMTAVD